MIDEGLAHKGPYQVEEAQFVSGNKSYNFKPNNNPPTHYTPALKNHENIFLWKWSADELKSHLFLVHFSV